MKDELAESLRRVVVLAEEMIVLASEGSRTGEGVACGVIFGTLRDTGYKLKASASGELTRAGHTFELGTKMTTGDRSSRAVEGGVTTEDESNMSETRKRVLIVDDEPDVVTYLQTWFGDHGFETTTALDGQQAMETLADEKPALITLDMSMPVQSGVKTYRAIKESDEFKGIPVIIITAIGEPMKTFLNKTKQVPEPEGFIAKPIELQELATLVKQVTA